MVWPNRTPLRLFNELGPSVRAFRRKAQRGAALKGLPHLYATSQALIEKYPATAKSAFSSVRTCFVLFLFAHARLPRAQMCLVLLLHTTHSSSGHAWFLNTKTPNVFVTYLLVRPRPFPTPTPFFFLSVFCLLSWHAETRTASRSLPWFPACSLPAWPGPSECCCTPPCEPHRVLSAGNPWGDKTK